SSDWSTSSSSSSASTSGERVGFQSSTSAPETGCHFPIAMKTPKRMSRKTRKKAPSTEGDSTTPLRLPRSLGLFRGLDERRDLVREVMPLGTQRGFRAFAGEHSARLIPEGRAVAVAGQMAAVTRSTQQPADQLVH